MRTSIYDDFTDAQFRAEALRRGYVLRGQDEAKIKLMWSRLEPIPEGINFEEEALANLRSQVKAEHIEFETRDMTDGKRVRVASLRTF